MDSGFLYVTVENVVATGDVGCRVSLDRVVKAYPGSYKTRGFPAAVLKFRGGLKASVLVFKNGKLICSGARNTETAIKALRKAASILRKAGIKFGKLETRIENIVVSSSLGLDYNLDELVESLPRSVYEPEYFPGLVHRMEKPKIVALIFPRGKAVLAGLKTEEEAVEAAKNLKQTIQNILKAKEARMRLSLAGNMPYKAVQS